MNLCSGGPRERRLLLGADHGDRARPEALGDLDGRGADTTGGAVDQDRLTLPDAPALGEGEVGGEVVHRQCRALVVRQGVGQCEGEDRRIGDLLGGAAVQVDARDPLADLEGARLRRARVEDDAGEVDAEGEGRLGLELVFPTTQQQVGEGDAGAVHLDQHVVRAGDGLGDLTDLDVGGTGERDDLGCAHGGTLARRGQPSTCPTPGVVRDERPPESPT